MKAIAKVLAVLPLASGESNNGNFWERQTVVFETADDTPRKLPLDFMGERRTKKTKELVKGDLCEVTFVINGREYDGRWFVTLEGLNVEVLRTAKQGEQKKMEMETETEPPQEQ